MTVSYHLEDCAFEWDDEKARSNYDKHGVTFEEAAEAVLDPMARPGEASVVGETRNSLMGFSYAQRLLLVVAVEKTAVTRIISARPATRAERKAYEQLG
ncbi:MAG TPA: BrnT family toxin [Longimicrobiaceae bacterium]|nr:BrnT family toxin [Longimicrobiaceae bacterium]